MDIVSADDIDIEQVQLTHPIATLGFWSQDSVISELRIKLRERLVVEESAGISGGGSGLVVRVGGEKGGLGVGGDGSVTLAGAAGKEATSSSSPPPPPPPSRTRRFFSRSSSSKQSKSNGSESLSNGATRSAATTAQERVFVSVKRDEICLRTVSDFGLYETLTRQAVIVRVVIRG